MRNVFKGRSERLVFSRNKFLIETTMTIDLKNKVVVITGGAVGIGSEIADRFLQNGAKVVVILDVDEKQGLNTVKILNTKYGANKSAFYKCDVTKDLEPITKKIYETYNYVDVLVNNAGILNDLQLKKTVDINVTALMEWSFAYWERMRKDNGGNGGVIMNLASIYGFRTDQFLPIYEASKHAVMGFTKSLGHEYNFKRSGVRVVAICPGFTKTNLTVDINTWDNDGLGQDFESFLKNQTWQTADFVGAAAVDIFEKADSGTAWLIEGARPVALVS